MHPNPTAGFRYRYAPQDARSGALSFSTPPTPFTSPATGYDSLLNVSASSPFDVASLELAALYASLSHMSSAMPDPKLHPLSSKELDFSSFNAELAVFPFDIVPASMSAASFDAQLESPLGLDDSPYSQYLVSPMFSPPELPSLDAVSPPSLFPSTAVRPNPPPPTRPIAPLPTRESSSSSTSSVGASSRRGLNEPTGFRSAEIPLLTLDAPIQPRNYLVPSATSRKHTVTAVERATVTKRPRSTSQAPVSSSSEPAVTASEEPSLADEVVATIEKKRQQNTMAARRSRIRKQQRLGELEGENDRLEDENAALKARVALLEGVMRTVGLTLP